jgi:hypothetical protein
VETQIVSFGNILVAGHTGGGATFGWVDYYSDVRQLFITFLAVTTMADNAADIAMGTLQKFCVLDEDLFPDLQRR